MGMRTSCRTPRTAKTSDACDSSKSAAAGPSAWRTSSCTTYIGDSGDPGSASIGMSQELVLLLERLCAPIAPIRTLSRVRPEMSPKGIGREEPPSAVRAIVRPLVSVAQGVPFEVVLEGEHLPALAAGEGTAVLARNNTQNVGREPREHPVHRLLALARLD
eukprot:CAMPEP_0170180418 /NCGR_PEP_ID=MMETSP0040_2-20121228/21916_1 /TAXON_ID=641309 /ORGANISM="Lotharella oceanica, Strain CCMP622" /LENGTH=160 /DNA_ID=CAMNT_0010425047 /DNA_START=287 /DNA_END=770 /DNA_ORIENTATION=-